MKIAIIGGAGFVGSHLVRAYLNARHDVFVIDSLVHGTREAIDPRARFYHLDVRDGKVQAVLQAERPDIVSHHAVYREHALPCENSLLDADVHIRGLLNVLEGCVSAQVSKLIFASGGNSLYRGCSLQDLARTGLLDEETEAYPQQPQDITRIAGEWYVRYYTRKYALPHLILRYADIYGESDPVHSRHPFTAFLSQLALQRRPTIRGTDREVRDHIFIDDVVRANLCALERGRNDTLHISSAQGYSVKQFYQAAARLLKSTIPPAYISSSMAEPTAVILDNRRARRVLNWQPEIDFPTGVRLTAERLFGKRAEVHTEPLVRDMEQSEQSARSIVMV
jgi:UDP-glucose 4-epimerase